MATRPRKPKAEPAPYPPGWEPFLAAIRANLADDTPRLVFADWLDENGDPDRAELIRLQCQLARAAANDPANHSADLRQKELVEANWEQWVRGFPRWVRADRFRHYFVRGFITSFAITAARFVTDGPVIVRLTPVEDLTLYRVTEAALRSPALSSVGGLTLEPIGSARVGVLATHPDLSALRRLFLGTGRDGRIRSPAHISRQSVCDLLANPTLIGLREFELRDTGHGDAVVRSLAANPFRSLEQLHLYRSGVTADGFGLLVRSPTAASLRGLYLAGNPIGDEGIQHLVESPFLRNLDNLNLSSCHLTPASARLLAEWPGLSTVRWMTLDGNDLREPEQAVILASPHAANLKGFRIQFPKP